MLILGRKEGEAILVGDDIRLVILSSDRRGVRIGIEAPAHVRIAREEIVLEITEENRRATANPGWAALLNPLMSGNPIQVG